MQPQRALLARAVGRGMADGCVFGMRKRAAWLILMVGVLGGGLLSACVGSASTPIVVPTLTRRPTATPTLRPTETPIPVPTQAPTKRPTPEGLPSSGALGDTWVRPADGMVMVYVPGGTYRMGTDVGDPLVQDDEVPPHAVTLGGFWIDQTEVTNEQYARCVAAGACQPPFAPMFERHERYYGSSDTADYPVIYVSWLHATEYCVWAGGALPSEAQWEYAARGPESLTYPWGNSPPSEALLNYDKIINDPVAVGSYPAGASWCGALDMAGNVYEWMNDWYSRYTPEAQTDPTGAERGIGHVLRGGSWFDGAEFVRAANRYVIREAYRDYVVPSGHGFNFGFRCVVSP
jgi:formylglycine-generating enzyme required for sulfatase activity